MAQLLQPWRIPAAVQNGSVWRGLLRDLGDDRTCMMWGDEDATHWHMGHIALAKTVTLAVMGETLFAMHVAS